MDKKVLAEQRGGALWLTINRPDARNAMDRDVFRLLESALRAAALDRSIRAIVLTGAGNQAFCAGADLKADSGTFNYDYSEPSLLFADLLRTAEACNLPMIARVNGHCFAGGMGLLAMCDMAIASSTSKFALPEVKVGLFPMQVSALLKTIIPPRKFAEMCMTGEPISAEDAAEWGLVNYVCEPGALDEKVAWLLDRILDKSPTAIRIGKYSLRHMSDMTRQQALAFAESRTQVLALTEDAREGKLAFQAKRKPIWKS